MRYPSGVIVSRFYDSLGPRQTHARLGDAMLEPCPGTSSCQEQTARPPASGVGLQRGLGPSPVCLLTGHCRCWSGSAVVANHGFSLRPPRVRCGFTLRPAERGRSGRSLRSRDGGGAPTNTDRIRRSPKTGKAAVGLSHRLGGHAAWLECPAPALATLTELRGSPGSPRAARGQALGKGTHLKGRGELQRSNNLATAEDS